MEKLSYVENNQYYLTEMGKTTLIKEVNNRVHSGEKALYDDKKFESLISYITLNYDKKLVEALGFNLKQNDVPIDKHLKIAMNRRKLELWFEANADGTNLTGEEIVSYFSSEDYQNGIEKSKFASTISELTDVLTRNVGLQNEEFFNSIHPDSTQKKH